MPGGRRTDRISQRDLEVLEFVARFGVVPREAVAVWGYEIAACERAEGKRIYSAEIRDGRHHRPDLVVLGDPPEAIEVELSDKSNRRLDEILRGWRWAIAEKRFGRVRCSSLLRVLRPRRAL